MINKRVITAALLLLSIMSPISAQGLKDAIGKYCLIGAAINQWQSDGQVPEGDAIIDKHFNCAVAENCMKPETLAPAEGIFDFRVADKFVGYCQQHKLKVLGHCLVWHSQAPDWWFTNGYTASPASKEVLKERIIKHIKTVVGHYKGQVHGWDVPDAELYYNDYSMAGQAKREAVCRLVKKLKDKGLRIDGVGMQSHNGLDYPDLVEYEKSIDAFAACGVKVMITELDLNVLPSPESFGGADIAQNFEYQQKLNPYTAGLPADKQKEVPVCLPTSRRRWISDGCSCSISIISTVTRLAASTCGASATAVHG